MSFEKVERLDAMSVREKDGKSFWHRLGVAFPAKQGPGWTLYLDSIPAPTEGQYKIVLMAPKPKDGAQEKQSRTAPGGGYPDADDVPFAPEWR